VKGAAFIPGLAFLFSSTNLVIELGIVLYLLVGLQFTLAEWLGGVRVALPVGYICHRVCAGYERRSTVKQRA
jgi:uncharacterized membrane protein YraQ (UPF0718 family)